MTSNLQSPLPKTRYSNSTDAMSADIYLRRAAILQDVPQHLWTVSMDQLEKYILPRQTFTRDQLDRIYAEIQQVGLYSKAKPPESRGRWPAIAPAKTESKRYEAFGGLQNIIMDLASRESKRKSPVELAFESDGNQSLSTPEGKQKEGRHDGALYHALRARKFDKGNKMRELRTILRTDEFKSKATIADMEDVSCIPFCQYSKAQYYLYRTLRRSLKQC
jgi:hypothetical protein